MVRAVRYSLLTKSINPAAPAPGGAAASPAPLMREGTVPMDEGRPWSGDIYENGPVTDPQSSYAHFGDNDPNADVEAWLDKAEDGTLIGWVRDGDDIYRYQDPDAWAMDVDGASLTRVDGGEVPLNADGTPMGAPAPETDDTTEPGAVGDDEEAMPSIGENAPSAFDAEEDEATTEEDPTDGLEDPTDLPEEEEHGGEDADESFEDVITDGVKPGEDPNAPAAPQGAEQGEEDDDPFADEGADDTETPEEAPAEEEAEEDPAEEATETPEEEAAEPGDDEPDADDEDEFTRRIKGGKMQVKHLPGQHNQEEHGNWAHHHIGHHRAGRRRSGSSAGGGSRPKAGEAAPGSSHHSPAPAAEPKKARLSPEAIKAMTPQELDAVMRDQDFFDFDTVMAAAEQYDKQRPLDQPTRDAVADTKAMSPEEIKAFAQVIPDNMLAWVHDTGRSSKGRARDARRDDFRAWAESAFLAAEEATRGHMVARAKQAEFDKKKWTTHDFFNGRMRLPQVNYYGSDELLAHLAEVGWYTPGDFDGGSSESPRQFGEN